MAPQMVQKLKKTSVQRAAAVKAVRCFIREIGFNPDRVAANYAAYTLQYLAEKEPDLEMAIYARNISKTQLKLFKIAWNKSQSPVKR